MNKDLKSSYKQAMSCNFCFKHQLIQHGSVIKAQPRWIGSEYFSSDERVCVLTINPGDIGPKSNILKLKSSDYLNELIELFQNDQLSWIELMKFLEKDMPNWGVGNKYMRLYFDYLGLKPNKSAFLNIMLCSAKKKNSRGQFLNYYSQRTMQNCFNLHTKKILEALDPNIVILSGKFVHEFAERNNFSELFPSIVFKFLGHYAARGVHWNTAVNDAKRISQEINKTSISKYLKEINNEKME